MAQALTTHFGLSDFDTALVADHSAVFHAFVFSAETLPVGDRSKDARADKPVAFRLKRAVIDSLRLRDFAMRPLPDFVRRCQRNSDSLKVWSYLRLLILLKSKHYFSEKISISNG